MALNDNAVLTAAVGHVFYGNIGLAPPTPSQLAALDPETFGAHKYVIALSSGTASGGTYDVTVESDTAITVPWDATASTLQNLLEASASVGAGNVLVTGTGIAAPGLTVLFVGALQGVDIDLVVDDTNLTGSTPVLAATETAPNGWVNIGHTSDDDLPEFGFDGGDSEVKGTWQNPNLKEVTTEDAADFLTLFLQQITTQAFTLYYGTNASAVPGVFGVDTTGVKLEKAFLVIIVDGDVKVGFHCAKASVGRDDAIQLPNDDFASLPIKATFLKMTGQHLFSWINEDLFV